MSRIVALVASPVVGGNTDTIVGAVLDGAMGLSTNEIVLYRLDKMRFAHGCRACRQCKTEGKCVQNDEVSDILEDIRRSDVLIVSAPVYFSGPAAQYKVLEDRMFSFFTEGGMTVLPAGKKAIVILSCTFNEDLARNMLDYETALYQQLGFEIMDKVLFVDEKGKKHSADDAELIERMTRLGSTLRNT
ncbi:MAG: flavodoxin family protein [Thermoplasmata archaeon]|nr:flavodoxin family protein [Thermoplasmata archaeon]